MLKRTHHLAIIGVGILTLVLLNLPEPFEARVKSAIGAAFLPLFGLRAAADSVVDRAAYQALPRSTLVDHLLRLERGVEEESAETDERGKRDEGAGLHLRRGRSGDDAIRAIWLGGPWV